MFWFAILHTLRAFAVRSLEIETFPVKLERIVSNYVEVFSSCRFMTANDPSHSFPTHLNSRSREAQNIPTQLTSSDHRLVSQNCVRPSIVIRFRLSAVLLCLVLRSWITLKVIVSWQKRLRSHVASSTSWRCWGCFVCVGVKWSSDSKRQVSAFFAKTRVLEWSSTHGLTIIFMAKQSINVRQVFLRPSASKGLHLSLFDVRCGGWFWTGVPSCCLVYCCGVCHLWNM